jgi:hypothetical protein
MRIIKRVLVIFLSNVAPIVAFAAPQSVGTPPPDPGAGGGGLSYTLANPLGFDTLEEFIVAILGVIVTIATPIVVVFIVLAGFNFVKAQGNPAEIEKAKKALTYAIIGGILILGAKAISMIIADLVIGFSKTP